MKKVIFISNFLILPIFAAEQESKLTLIDLISPTSHQRKIKEFKNLIYKKNIKELEKFLEENKSHFNINQKFDLNLNTALHIAVKLREPEMIRMLIINNADVDAKNKFYMSPIQYNFECNCKSQKYKEINEILLKAGAKIESIENEILNESSDDN